jgi:hypothetical protein
MYKCNNFAYENYNSLTVKIENMSILRGFTAQTTQIQLDYNDVNDQILILRQERELIYDILSTHLIEPDRLRSAIERLDNLIEVLDEIASHRRD